jgi:hypothetical protein
MIPNPNDFGNLPLGGHYCTWEEFNARFRTNPRRNQLCIQFEEIAAVARRCGFIKVMIGGSFPTSKSAPSDMDLAWITEPDVTKDTVKPDCLNLMEDSAAKRYYGWNMQYLPVDSDEEKIQYWARQFGYCFKTKRDRGMVILDL